MHESLTMVLASWSWEPQLIPGLLLAATAYILGWWRLQQAARNGGGIARWRAWCYAGGIMALVIALVSPIDTFSDRSFVLHMAQHILLSLVAAPLLLLGLPLVPVILALPHRARRPAGRLLRPIRPLHAFLHVLTNPAVALVVYVVTLIFWHIPRFYDLALRKPLVHDLEHLLYFGTALLYWWPAIHPTGGRRRLGYGLLAPYLMVCMIEAALIGLVLTFVSFPLYSAYEHVAPLWGLSVLADQQLGGALLLGASAVLSAVLLCVVFQLLMTFETGTAVVTSDAPGSSVPFEHE